MLYTIGYAGMGLERFFAALESCGISDLVDTRFQPRTRLPGFNKWELSRECSSRGIKYHHNINLGNVLYKSSGIELADEETGLKELEALLLDPNSRYVAIMCACKKPEKCHRTYIAKALRESMTSTGEPLGIVNINDASDGADTPSVLRKYQGVGVRLDVMPDDMRAPVRTPRLL
jgi:uncharacterized protein (DUF488 family)